ncbi:excalibur calcium-binding domain-containing protein [Kibdelosporangium philippinense]|uniref:Excalibur calcium-binding domain-containing protein n=1 Tax=Kibdelosporangium philippinense TaxID=211113 RepID=A0ABS8ZNQ1_9PSEU|nr:excalibur calcium-binding domain-containing protein [Kibdelosporangium philippinense]MCE7009381.1 excalibur calcium-binding domain-containing protein [Kibdelosporangium philippinense]
MTIPLDLAGRTASKVDSELRALGFTLIKYLGPEGKEVSLDPSWIVVSVVGAGGAMRPDTAVYIKVDKPAPPPPKTSTKTTPKTTPKPLPPKTQQPAAPPKAAYYANCSAARAAGAAPVYRGQPGYGRHLDRDGDGVGCEK